VESSLPLLYVQATAMATFELYRRSTIGMCLTETLDEMVSSGTLSPELAIQVLVQFDKVGCIIGTVQMLFLSFPPDFICCSFQSMTDALDNQVKSKVNIKVCPCSTACLCKKNILLCNEQHPLPLFSLYVMDPPSLLVPSKLR
jgi:hypothetical protein